MSDAIQARRLHAGKRCRLASWLLLVVLLLSGCGATYAPHSHAPPLVSDSGADRLSLGALTDARRAALAFARSYLASTHRANPLLPQGVSDELAEQLRSNALRFSHSHPGPRLHLVGLRLDPESRRRVAAAMTLAAPREPGFSIGFVLELRAGQWLATRLEGN